MRWLFIALAGVALASSCQSAQTNESIATTTTTAGSGAGGGGGADMCIPPPPEVEFALPFNPQWTCCNDAICRGSCTGWLTGNGQEIALHCSCGLVMFDGQAHYGPPGCGEGEECCVLPIGNNVCVPEGQCFDCRPERSSGGVLAGCCAATTPCRGECGFDTMGPCSCVQIGDGGCAEGYECCNHPLTHERTCVPWGECHIDLGPCPPEASSAGVAVDCCNDWPCRGRCEDNVEAGLKCNCGGSWGGCQIDEECCLAPSGKNIDPATTCVPIGQCTQGG